MTTPAHAATAVATAATTHQDERTACCTRTQLLGVAGITRQSRQCSGSGKSQRKSANKTRRDKIAFHDCVPFVGHVVMWASKLLTECMAAPLSGSVSMRRVRRPSSSFFSCELVVPTPRCKGASCDISTSYTTL